MKKKQQTFSCVFIATLLTLAIALPAFGLDPKLAPGQNFNLKAFKLQTLTPGLAFVEISPDSLTRGYTSRFFHTDSIDGSMVFWTPSNGGTTSGSSYPRCELRQTSGGAPWKLTDTTMYKMSAVCKVTIAPSANPTVTIGQIHGSNNNSELVELEWNGLSAGNCKLTAMFQTNDAAGSNLFVTAATGLSLGSQITYDLTMKKGVVSVTVNGKTVSQTYTTQYYGTTDGYYFKAGNYLQYHSTNASAVSEAKFYSLRLSSSAPTAIRECQKAPQTIPASGDALTPVQSSSDRAAIFNLMGKRFGQSRSLRMMPPGIFLVKTTSRAVPASSNK
jgi:hypothetical protein